MPSTPKVGYKSAAGHTEYKDAPDDSPEFLEYMAVVSKISTEIEQAKNDFIYDYAVEAWNWDGGEWQTEPPDNWEFPQVLARHGLAPSGNKRIDYIRYALLIHNDDTNTVLNDALGIARPITEAEVQAALGGFRGDEKRDTTE